MPLLDIRDLSVTFATSSGPFRAVDGVDIAVDPGEVLSIVGESGSGKSVSMMALLQLLPDGARVSGSAKFRGQELVGMPERHIRRLRGAPPILDHDTPTNADA